MKPRFKVQQYQTEAVATVVDCFAGRPRVEGLRYRIDPGRVGPAGMQTLDRTAALDAGLRNAEIALSPAQLLANVQEVQHARNLPVSTALATGAATAPGALDLDVEMATGPRQ